MAVPRMQYTDLETLTAVIARSRIVVARPPCQRLPTGFDDVDIAILNWLAAEGRRARSLVQM